MLCCSSIFISRNKYPFNKHSGSFTYETRMWMLEFKRIFRFFTLCFHFILLFFCHIFNLKYSYTLVRMLVSENKNQIVEYDMRVPKGSWKLEKHIKGLNVYVYIHMYVHMCLHILYFFKEKLI